MVLALISSLSTQAQDTPIQVEGSLNVLIPANLRFLSIDNPYVEYRVDVGANGTLFDAMPTKSNHHDLLPAAEEVLQSVTLIPATQGGEPVRSRANLRVTFYDAEQRAGQSGANVPFGGSSPFDATRRRIYANTAQNFAYDRSGQDELDSPIALLRATKRVYQPQEDVRTAGKCLIEFYIDLAGEVCFPRVLESDNEEVTISALLTLQESHFTPPRKKGRPTYVKIRQRFVFG